MATANSTHEQWRPVVGYEDHYMVSDQGRVKALARVLPHAHCSTKTYPERIMKPVKAGKAGHLTVGLAIGGRSRRRYVHRLVLEAFIGPPLDGKPHGLHRDDDNTNNRLDNLYWGSPSDNMHDRVRNGRHHQARKTHCDHGHEFTPENTGRQRVDNRRCLTCHRLYTRERRRRAIA